VSEEKNLRYMLLCATQDRAFRLKFLNNPEAVAKEYNVKLKPEHLEKIKKAASFIDSLNDIRLPPGPIYYPIDPVLNTWALGEIRNVLKYSYLTKINWILYSAPDFNQAVGAILKEKQR
jgi:hypothetical protein